MYNDRVHGDRIYTSSGEDDKRLGGESGDDGCMRFFNGDIEINIFRICYRCNNKILKR